MHATRLAQLVAVALPSVRLLDHDLDELRDRVGGDRHGQYRGAAGNECNTAVSQHVKKQVWVVKPATHAALVELRGNVLGEEVPVEMAGIANHLIHVDAHIRVDANEQGACNYGAVARVATTEERGCPGKKKNLIAQRWYNRFVTVTLAL